MIATVVSEINALIEAGNVVDGCKEILGIARIHTEDNDQYPAVRDDEEDWNKVIPDGKEDLMCYHRVLSIDEEIDEEFDYSPSNQATKDVFNMCLVVIFSSKYDYDDCITLKNLFPPTSTGYTFITVSEIETIQDEIVEDEWGATLDYSRHKTPFNIFKINYTVEVNKCYG